MKYEDWEEKQGISRLSPEAYYAEEAWNFAITEARGIIRENHGDIAAMDAKLAALYGSCAS